MKKRLLLRCIHHFKSDLINNMDHMRMVKRWIERSYFMREKIFIMDLRGYRLFHWTYPREVFDSSVIMPFSWCVVAVTLPI